MDVISRLVRALEDTFTQIGRSASEPDTHQHKCSDPYCGTVWQHDGRESKGNANAHTCPKCGTEQWNRHYE